MKKSESIKFLAVLFSVCFITQSAFAGMHEYDEVKAFEKINVLTQASTLLEAGHPDLADKLADMAEDKKDYMNKKREKMKEHKEKHQEMMMDKNEDIGKIKQAAAVLNEYDAPLADDLEDIAKRWEKKLKEKQEKWEDKKDKMHS